MPTPFITYQPYDVETTRHQPQIRALYAAIIILVVCLFVIAARV